MGVLILANRSRSSRKSVPIGVYKHYTAISMQAKRRCTATVWGRGIESSDWPPNKGPAREPGARILGAVR